MAVAWVEGMGVAMVGEEKAVEATEAAMEVGRSMRSHCLHTCQECTHMCKTRQCWCKWRTRSGMRASACLSPCTR